MLCWKNCWKFQQSAHRLKILFNKYTLKQKKKSQNLSISELFLELLPRFELGTSSLPIKPFTYCSLSPRPQTVAITGFLFRRLCISPPPGVTFRRISPQIHPKPSPQRRRPKRGAFFMPRRACKFVYRFPIFCIKIKRDSRNIAILYRKGAWLWLGFYCQPDLANDG